MRWLLVLLACLIARTSATVVDSIKADLKHDVAFNTTRSATVIFTDRTFGSRMYSITMNDTHIQMNGTPLKKFDNRSVAIDPKDRIHGRIYVTTSTEAIVVYGLNSSEIVDGTRRTDRWTVLLFRPFYSPLEYTSMPIPVDEVPASYPTFLPLVKVYSDDVDVFLPSLRECAPCHFNRTGYMTKPTSQLATQEAPPSNKGFHLVGTRLGGIEQPYLFAYNYANGSAVLKYLNFEYEDYYVWVVLYGSSFGRSIGPRLLDHAIDVLDANQPNFGDEAYSTICYAGHELRCAQYDSNVRLRFNESVPLLNDHQAHAVSLKILWDGTSIVGVIQSPNQSDKPFRRSLYVIDKNGQLMKSLDFGEIDKVYRNVELKMWYYGDYFCLHTIEMEKNDAIDAHEVVKCVEYESLRN